MTTITNYFEQAQLSMAAYALNLQPGMSGAADTNYTNRLETAGMSASQAKEFAKNYSVIDQSTDPVSGFSGTVFSKGGVKYIAIRGAERRSHARKSGLQATRARRTETMHSQDAHRALAN